MREAFTALRDFIVIVTFVAVLLMWLILTNSSLPF
jgi:hypothetical protein